MNNNERIDITNFSMRDWVLEEMKCRLDEDVEGTCVSAPFLSGETETDS